MVDARLEVLIVARDQFRRVLRGINETVTRVREGVRRLDRTRTNRIQAAFGALRDRLRRAGVAASNLVTRLRTVNRVRTDVAVANMRRLQVATSAAGRAAIFLRSALGPFIAAAALIAGIVAATRVFAGFEQQMAAVRAITGATEEQFALLSEEARRLGATTRFTAQQAADGLEFLARAGFSAEDATAALEGTLNLASAGMLDLATSADIVSNVIQQFGLDAAETGRVADVLAITAASANTNVFQLGEAFKFVGPIARALNISVEDTSELLGLLGNAGIQASNAGAGLRRAFFGLINTTPKAAKALAQLGLTTEEVQLTGENTSEVFKLLGERGLSAAQAVQIFGIRGSTVALSLAEAAQQGNSLAEAIAGSDGAAKDISDTIEDTLLGDFRRLISAIQEVLLQAGDAGLVGGLRSLVQGLTAFARALGGAGDSTSTLGQLGTILLRVLQAIGAVFQFLIDIGVVRALFLPIQIIVASAAAAVEDLVAGLEKLGIIAVDTSAEVADRITNIQQRLASGTLGLEGLDRVIATVRTRLRQFGNEVVRLTQQRGQATSRAERAAIDDQIRVLNTRIAVERDILGKLPAVRKEAVEAAAKAAADAEKTAQSESIEQIGKDTEERIKLLEERRKAIVAESAREVAAFRQAADELTAIDKLRFAQGLPRLENFLADRQALLTAGLDSEIRAQREVIRSLQEETPLRVLLATDQAEIEQIRVEAAAELIKAQTKLNALVSEQTIQSLDQSTQSAEATQKLVAIVEAATRTVVGTGVIEDFTAIRQRIETDFNKTIRNLEVSAEQAKLFSRAIDIQAGEAAIAQLEAAVKASNDRLSRDEELLQAQRTSRQITQQEFIERTAEAQSRAFEEQLSFVQQLQALDPGLFSQEQLDRIALVEARIIQLREVVTPEIEALTSAFQQAGEQFFQDLIDGTLTAEEAFKKFAKSIIAQIQKIIIQQLVLKAVQASSGGIGAVGAAITAKDGGFIQKLGGGGPVRGPGTGRSDSVPALLSAGEFVMPEHITRSWRSVLEVMRAGKFGAFLKGSNISLSGVSIPRMGRFQAGGVVEPRQTTEASGEQRSIRIINAIDPSLLNNFLASSEGEQTLLNVIGRNPENIKRILA